MLTDTHSHIYYPELLNDIDSVIQRAESNGIGRIISPAVDLKTSRQLLDISERHGEIYCALGIHPCDVSKVEASELDEIAKLVKHPKVVAIGESGLDYYWDISNIELQKYFFSEQIRLASELNIPIIVHTRNSLDDAIEMISGMYSDHPVKAHFHCFSGDTEQLRRCLDIPDSHISFCGNVTYKNSMLDEVVKLVPDDRLLCETDSPFLPPVPYRGKKNEPSYMIKTIEWIASKRSIELNELCTKLELNASRFFNLNSGSDL